MSSIETEKWIQHEVKLRMHAEKHHTIDKRFDKIDNNMTILRYNLTKVLAILRFGSAVCTLIAIPVLLHFFKVF
jgi:hypothetical protein